MNKQQLIDMFDGEAHLIKYLEDDILSIDRTLLPQCALDVLAGKGATSEYWQFLIDQVKLQDQIDSIKNV